MIRALRVLLAAIWLVAPAAPAAAQNGPAVVELFTSQGCYSCPPADKFLGKLKKRDDVIALSMHVTYWDRLGWQDRYGKARHDRRQRRYGRRLGLDNVYTPQMVVDGQLQAVGSRTSTVRERLETALAEPNPVQPRLASGGGVELVLPAQDQAVDARLWLVTYDKRHRTEVTAGENRGKTLVNHNVVRAWHQLGRWQGKRRRQALPLAKAREQGRDGYAVLVQSGQSGPILGAVAGSLNTS